MKWVRIDCTLDAHPDIIAAGYDGSQVFQALLRTSKLFDLGGVIPAKYASPSYLSRQLNTNTKTVGRGLRAAVEAGLLDRDDEGNVTIPGWDDFNGEHELETIRENARARWHRWNDKRKLDTNVSQTLGQTLGNVSKREANDLTGDGTGRDITGRDGTRQDDPETSLRSVSPTQPVAQAAPETVKRKPSLEWDDSTESIIGITDKKRQEWAKIAPSVDIEHEIAKAQQWCRDNPRKRPRKDFAGFLTSWMNRAHEKQRKGVPVNGEKLRTEGRALWGDVVRLAMGVNQDYLFLQEITDKWPSQVRTILEQKHGTVVEAVYVLSKAEPGKREFMGNDFVKAYSDLMATGG